MNKVVIIGEGYKEKSWDQLVGTKVMNRLGGVVWFSEEIVKHLGEWRTKYDTVHLLVKNDDSGIPGLSSWTELGSIDIGIIGGK